MNPSPSEAKLIFKQTSLKFEKSGFILKDFNFEVAQGDFVVILGASGSGKSTLLRLISGLQKPSSGTVSVLQSNPFDKAFVFQESHLMPWRSLIENVELPLELIGASKTVRRQKVLNALELVDLSHATELTPAELSGGMKMRASLARALVSEPSLLLLDEPFAALDEQTRFKLAEELRELWRKKKMTVIFVTHSVHEACFLANRIVTLSEKPAQIKHDIRINLPEKRTTSLRTEADFNAELKRLYNILENKGDAS